MTEAIRGRKHSFNVILPRRASNHSDSDLRLMLVSLKNAMITSSVHILKIENELKKRGKMSSILDDARASSLSDLEIDEKTGDVRWRRN